MKKGSSKHYLVETIDSAPEPYKEFRTTGKEVFNIPEQGLTGKKIKIFCYVFS